MRSIRQTALASIVAVAVFSSFLTTDSARAADSSTESVTLSPTSKTYKVDAGQTFNDFLKVLNDGNVAYDFIVYGAPYSVSSGSYDPSYTSTASNADAYTWVQFKQTSWHAEPHETIRVPYTVYVKKNASPGGHYGVLFVEVQPSAASSGSTIVRKKRVGAVMYATVNGDVHLSGKAVGTNIGWFQSSAPLQATTSVENTGNSDFWAKVTYQVSDVFGAVKYTYQSDYAVLPSTTRDIPLSWENVPWFGLYKARVTTSFLDQTSMIESYVLVMPIWLVLLVGTAVVSGGIYAIWRPNHRAQR